MLGWLAGWLVGWLVGWQATLVKDKDMLITSVVPQGCNIQTNPDLDFGKGLGPAIFKALEDIFKKAINSVINTAGCKALDTAIAGQVSPIARPR